MIIESLQFMKTIMLCCCCRCENERAPTMEILRQRLYSHANPKLQEMYERKSGMCAAN